MDNRIISVMKKVEPDVVKIAKDDSMPSCIGRFLEDMIHNFWVDITDLVRFQLRMQIIKRETIEIINRPPKYKILIPWYKFRNWYTYAVFPYDLSFWDRMKSLSFIFFKILQCIPYYGIQAYAYFILFLSIDKDEEYQLVNYILTFKNIQFLTTGCLSAIFGYFQYLYCANLLPIERAKFAYITEKGRNLAQLTPDQLLNMSSCFQYGPGTTLNLYTGVISYTVQVVLIWICFFLTYRSKSKVDFLDEEMKIQKRTRGGRLTYFMIYDLIAFIFSFGFSFYIYYEFYYIPDAPELFENQLSGLIYMAKVIYGLLSLPFVIFLFEIFILLFTTSKPTGYDKMGNILPKLDNLNPIYKSLPPEEVEEIDIGEVDNENE